jgi:DNA replication protein DnaC
MNEQILQKMKTMKLYGMVRAFSGDLAAAHMQVHTADELLDMLITAEWDDRAHRKHERGVKNARFRYKAMVEQISFSGSREQNKNQILRLAACSFIAKKENVLITGSTGNGKSYIASAVGHEACSQGYRVLYEHSTKLFARLKMAKADGSYLKELVRMEKQELLIIDDFGMQPLDAQSRAILMEIIEDRHGKRSTLFTSQVPVNNWYEVIGEQTIADAILDRIIHDAHRLELHGDSMRKRKETLSSETSEKTH